MTATTANGRDIARLLRICTTPLHDLHNLLIEGAEEIESLRTVLTDALRLARQIDESDGLDAESIEALVALLDNGRHRTPGSSAQNGSTEQAR